MSGEAFIPVNTPLLDGNEARYLAECIESGWISSEGPFVARFEEMFAARVGRRHGIAVTNGSAALEISLAALGIGPGDEVILPTLTIISCAAAVIRVGATPVVVDVDPATWTMDIDQVEASIGPRTRAIMPVHLYGLPVDMRRLIPLAERHGLVIVEDAAQAHGLCIDGRPCGSFGALATFSFYPNKLVTTGEGGLVATDDDRLAQRLRSLRNLGFGTGAHRFVHERLGWNLRMTNLQAAVGLAQVERLDDHVALKRRIGALYQRLLEGTPGLRTPVHEAYGARNLYWVYGVALEPEVPFDAAEAMARLARLGIGCRPFFWPMHEQPCLHERGLFEGIRLPVSETLARRGFYLPSGLALNEEEIERSAAALRKVMTR